jgi:hypothetical protein
MRANRLIESILKEMQQALRDPQRCARPEWEMLFGSKQSMVVNLQKLVQALAVIPISELSKPSEKGASQEVPELTKQEIELLAAWLTQMQTPSE